MVEYCLQQWTPHTSLATPSTHPGPTSFMSCHRKSHIVLYQASKSITDSHINGDLLLKPQQLVHIAESCVFGLQVEYCFTSEGTDKRPQASSLRGLDAATYYRHNGVLNCGHPVVRNLILDSLHHWADEYQVDGFCFVNAETLVQGVDFCWSVLSGHLLRFGFVTCARHIT